MLGILGAVAPLVKTLFKTIDKTIDNKADAEKIKGELAEQNLLVEDWGGKYQCQEISAKSGKGIDELMEKILLEAEVLELKANHKTEAQGVVIESRLDKGLGIVGDRKSVV